MRKPRIYDALAADFSERQMKFFSGPRQVGKTNICRAASKEAIYLNWDLDQSKNLILGPVAELERHLNLDKLEKGKTTIIFDEIHKYGRWKQFLKGFFDNYQVRTNILVTGSSKLDTYKKGGDSLQGRYFPYRIHPFSCGELAHSGSPFNNNHRLPAKLSRDSWESLLWFGGFPEPLLKASKSFSTKWKNQRNELVLREEIRDLTRVQELEQIRLLANLLESRCGSTVNFSDLAKSVRVSVDTVIRWIGVLSSLHYCFLIRPWSKNVSKSLLKEPKIFLWDWSIVRDIGARNENMIASHLLKYVHWQQDTGNGDFKLHFIRDKNKREVDFLVVKEGEPYILVEVKTKDQTLSPALRFFSEKLKVPHSFQAVIEMDYVDADCFKQKKPVIVPAKTLLSQLT